MGGGLKLARPRRRRKRLWAAAAALVLAVLLPRLAAWVPAAAEGVHRWLGDRLVPGYSEKLDALEAQNAALHGELALAADAMAENEALRDLLGCGRTTGSWQPARVVERHGSRVTLACTAPAGAPVVDPRGRYAGRVMSSDGDGRCQIRFAGSEDAPCAGLAGTYAGLLETEHGWALTGLPAGSGLTEGTPVTTPEGCWLGALAQEPCADANGLTARAALTDTANLNSTVFFVKIG